MWPNIVVSRCVRLPQSTTLCWAFTHFLWRKKDGKSGYATFGVRILASLPIQGSAVAISRATMWKSHWLLKGAVCWRKMLYPPYSSGTTTPLQNHCRRVRFPLQRMKILHLLTSWNMISYCIESGCRLIDWKLVLFLLFFFFLFFTDVSSTVAAVQSA